MCGIVSFLSLDGAPVSRADVQLSASMIAHRGPDGAGMAILDEGRVGLGHVRLAVVDLLTGQQPMFDVERTACIVFNGEIYDHAALRARLEGEGERFATRSDTEVILALYRRYGPDGFDRLEGEFAFVLWDLRRRRLVAARDRFGLKPLFVRQTAAEVILASEAKAILALPRVPRALSRAWITGPMLSMAPKAACAFEGIEALPPAHRLVVERDGARDLAPYWKRRFVPVAGMTLAEAAAGVRARFATAVERRLVADVPVCTYLSGGIDSTLVCLEMARLGGRRAKAFNVGFSRSVFDESEQAREIAAHAGVDFETVPCDLDALAEHLVPTVFQIETFLANPSAVGKFLLSRRVRADGYKVTLTGEGSDEVFAGYPYFKLEAIWRLLLSPDAAERRRGEALLVRFRKLEARSEGLLWNGNRRFAQLTPRFGPSPLFLEVRTREFGRLLPRLLDTARLGLRPEHDPQALLEREFGGDGLEALHPLHASLSLSAAQLSSFIIPTLGDRVEMAHGVEGRTPFLDRDLVEFAATIPAEHHLDLDALREKRVLHEAFGPRLPAVVKREHKHPFFAPSWRALHGTAGGRALFAEYLSPGRLRDVGVFEPRFTRAATALSRVLPANLALSRRLDVLAGVVLTVQILHEQLIARRPRPASLLSLRDVPSAGGPSRRELPEVPGRP
jgi:asparagine synthase (glutamine-hydrolysing)